jgi:hypothetical protein
MSFSSSLFAKIVSASSSARLSYLLTIHFMSPTIHFMSLFAELMSLLAELALCVMQHRNGMMLTKRVG